MSRLSARLRSLRKEHGLSQSDMSEVIGKSKSSVNMYERGEREPGIEILEAYADYFGVDMEYLIGKSDVRNRYKLFDDDSISQISVEEKNYSAQADRNSEISERIMASIKRKNISYGELSHITGIAKSALQRYATGETEKVPIPRLEAIAAALNVSASYLMGWEENPCSLKEKSSPALQNTGKKHPVPTNENEMVEKLIELFLQLNSEQQKMLLAQIRGLIDSQ